MCIYNLYQYKNIGWNIPLTNEKNISAVFIINFEENLSINPLSLFLALIMQVSTGSLTLHTGST